MMSFLVSCCMASGFSHVLASWGSGLSPTVSMEKQMCQLYGLLFTTSDPDHLETCRRNLGCVFSRGEAGAFFVKEYHHSARKVGRAGIHRQPGSVALIPTWRDRVPSLAILWNKNKVSHADLLDTIYAHMWGLACGKRSIKWPEVFMLIFSLVLLDIVYLLFVSNL